MYACGLCGMHVWCMHTCVRMPTPLVHVCEGQRKMPGVLYCSPTLSPSDSLSMNLELLAQQPSHLHPHTGITSKPALYVGTGAGAQVPVLSPTELPLLPVLLVL